MNKYQNVEQIIKYLQEKIKSIKEIQKLDGVSYKVTVKSNRSRNKVPEEIKIISHEEIGINEIGIASDEEDNNSFIVQYFDFIPKYTEEEIKNMYFKNFEFLIENIKTNNANNPNIRITRTFLIDNMDSIVNRAMNIYYRSCVNRNKENLEKDYTKNSTYVAKIKLYFLEFSETLN